MSALSRSATGDCRAGVVFVVPAVPRAGEVRSMFRFRHLGRPSAILVERPGRTAPWGIPVQRHSPRTGFTIGVRLTPRTCRQRTRRPRRLVRGSSSSRNPAFVAYSATSLTTRRWTSSPSQRRPAGAGGRLDPQLCPARRPRRLDHRRLDKLQRRVPGQLLLGRGSVGRRPRRVRPQQLPVFMAGGSTSSLSASSTPRAPAPCPWPAASS